VPAGLGGQPECLLHVGAVGLGEQATIVPQPSCARTGFVLVRSPHAPGGRRGEA
jgi:hypothetical protein